MRVEGICSDGGRHRQINSLFAGAGRTTRPVAREIENVENLRSASSLYSPSATKAAAVMLYTCWMLQACSHEISISTKPVKTSEFGRFCTRAMNSQS